MIDKAYFEQDRRSLQCCSRSINCCRFFPRSISPDALEIAVAHLGRQASPASHTRPRCQSAWSRILGSIEVTETLQVMLGLRIVKIHNALEVLVLSGRYVIVVGRDIGQQFLDLVDDPAGLIDLIQNPAAPRIFWNGQNS